MGNSTNGAGHNWVDTCSLHYRVFDILLEQTDHQVIRERTNDTNTGRCSNVLRDNYCVSDKAITCNLYFSKGWTLVLLLADP